MTTQRSGDKRIEILSEILRSLGTACELEFPGGDVHRFGDQPPAFRVIFKNRRALRTPLTQYALARAYVEKDIDLEGDMLALFDVRERLQRITQSLSCNEPQLRQIVLLEFWLRARSKRSVALPNQSAEFIATAG